MLNEIKEIILEPIKFFNKNKEMELNKTLKMFLILFAIHVIIQSILMSKNISEVFLAMSWIVWYEFIYFVVMIVGGYVILYYISSKQKIKITDVSQLFMYSYVPYLVFGWLLYLSGITSIWVLFLFAIAINKKYKVPLVKAIICVLIPFLASQIIQMVMHVPTVFYEDLFNKRVKESFLERGIFS